jgi:hypothetical protein
MSGRRLLPWRAPAKMDLVGETSQGDTNRTPGDASVGERPSALALIGGAIAIAGVVLVRR